MKQGHAVLLGFVPLVLMLHCDVCQSDFCCSLWGLVLLVLEQVILL